MDKISWKSEVFEISGGRSPLLGGLHVTCDAHFRTWLSYSSQSHVWKFGLDWFSYRVHKHKKKKKITDAIENNMLPSSA